MRHCRSAILERECPGASLGGEANVLVMPNVDAANIAYNLLRIAAGNGITVGGILLGAAKPGTSWRHRPPCGAS